jgi:uncharacterized alpha-E superfamily protein
MLSRTADHLFWMSRYVERAENLARLLDVTWQMSMVPQSVEAANQNWYAVIVLNSLEKAYFGKYDHVTADNVLRFMVSDDDNPSSVRACLRGGRENAHAVRGTITADMWETLNATWLDVRGRSHDELMANGPAEFFEWVKMRAALTYGATLGTLLRDEAYGFIRLGTLLERADNTARILDVKYHVLAPYGEEPTTDFYQWGALLRSVSAFEVYRRVFPVAISPERVAELLILQPKMPRSLLFCMNGVVKSLELLANRHSGEAIERARQLRGQLCEARIEPILARGLHGYLSDFMDRIYELGDDISHDFLTRANQTD